MINLTQRPGRVICAVATLICLWFWYVFLRDTNLQCELPVVVQHIIGERPAANYSKIAKCTVATNVLDNDLIHRALRTHQRHNHLHNYKHFIAPHEAVSNLIEHDVQKRPAGAWTKPAYLLSIIVAELEKEEEERLEWIFWFDADTIIANFQTPLEIFLPPQRNKDLAEIHLIIGGNWDGLNSGSFALRVHPWSVSLLSAVLAYPIYQSKKMETDRFRDQSAFQWLLEAADSPLASTPMKGREHWAEIPMRWFNSVPFNNAFSRNGFWILAKNMTPETFDNGTETVYNDGNPARVKPWKVMRGDLAVHFAGTTAGKVRESWLRPWLDRVEAELPEWNNATTQEILRVNAENYWARISELLVLGRKQPNEAARKLGEEGKSGRGALEPVIKNDILKVPASRRPKKSTK